MIEQAPMVGLGPTSLMALTVWRCGRPATARRPTTTGPTAVRTAEAYTYGLPLLTTDATYLTQTSIDVSKKGCGPVRPVQQRAQAERPPQQDRRGARLEQPLVHRLAGPEQGAPGPPRAPGAGPLLRPRPDSTLPRPTSWTSAASRHRAGRLRRLRARPASGRARGPHRLTVTRGSRRLDGLQSTRTSTPGTPADPLAVRRRPRRAAGAPATKFVQRAVRRTLRFPRTSGPATRALRLPAGRPGDQLRRFARQASRPGESSHSLQHRAARTTRHPLRRPSAAVAAGSHRRSPPHCPGRFREHDGYRSGASSSDGADYVCVQCPPWPRGLTHRRRLPRRGRAAAERSTPTCSPAAAAGERGLAHRRRSAGLPHPERQGPLRARTSRASRVTAEGSVDICSRRAANGPGAGRNWTRRPVGRASR